MLIDEVIYLLGSEFVKKCKIHQIELNKHMKILCFLKKVFYFIFLTKPNTDLKPNLGNTGKSQSNHYVWDTFFKH